MNFKSIHIGNLIEKTVAEKDIDFQRICKFLKKNALEINAMYGSKSLDTEDLLLWSKLLEYDFFRIYSQHLILYSPALPARRGKPGGKPSVLPEFRKNIYTGEIVSFILGLIEKGDKTKIQISEEYGIPRATLYRWIAKNAPNRD